MILLQLISRLRVLRDFPVRSNVLEASFDYFSYLLTSSMVQTISNILIALCGSSTKSSNDWKSRFKRRAKKRGGEGTRAKMEMKKDVRKLVFLKDLGVSSEAKPWSSARVVDLSKFVV
jgi:hypothetical protein